MDIVLRDQPLYTCIHSVKNVLAAQTDLIDHFAVIC